MRVLALDDAAALEVQLIENSQRQDVHPYEEAAGYQRLLTMPGYDVAALADKCGKSESHIYSRLSLLQLISDVADAYQQERISTSHANQIARLPDAKQKDALDACFRKEWPDNEPRLLPAKALALWIATHVYVSLSEAPFALDDAALLSEAGPCTACSKRSGYNVKLFDDVQSDMCLDGECHQKKVDALIQVTLAAKPEIATVELGWRGAKQAHPGSLSRHEFREIIQPEIASADLEKTGGEATEEADDRDDADEEEEEVSGVCEFTRDALVTYGERAGKTIRICSNRECPIHHPQPQRNEPTPEEAARQQALKRAEAARQRKNKERAATFARIMENIPAVLSPLQLRIVLRALVANADYDLFEDSAAHYISEDENNQQDAEEVLRNVADRSSDADLPALLVRIALTGHVALPYHADDKSEDHLAAAANAFLPAPPKAAKAVKKAAISKATVKKPVSKKASPAKKIAAKPTHR